VRLPGPAGTDGVAVIAVLVGLAIIAAVLAAEGFVIRAVGSAPVTLRTAWFSARLRPRVFVACVVLLADALAVGVWSIMVGDFHLTVGQVLGAVFGDGGKD